MAASSSLQGRTCSHHCPLRSPGCKVLLSELWHHFSTSRSAAEWAHRMPWCHPLGSGDVYSRIQGAGVNVLIVRHGAGCQDAWVAFLAQLTNAEITDSLLLGYDFPNHTCPAFGLPITMSKWASVHGVQAQDSIMSELTSRMNLSMAIPTTRSSLSWWPHFFEINFPWSQNPT